jgi:glycosyltransferase involved in cell wall biosynthesis
VSTSVGAEGLELHHEANCLIADSPQNFANSCIRLLNDKDERKRLGEAVRHLAVDTYSEETVNRLIFQALNEILTNSVLSE